MDFEDMLNEGSQGAGSQGNSPGNSPTNLSGTGGGSVDDMFSGMTAPAQQEAAPAQPAADDFDFGGPSSAPAAAAAEEPAAAAQPVAAPPAGDEPLRAFVEQSRKALQARDEEADRQHQEVREKAAALLQRLAGERQEQMKARRQRHQDEEQQTKARNEALFSDGPVWDRVLSLIDASPAQNDKQARKTARMRQIFDHLRTSQ